MLDGQRSIAEQYAEIALRCVHVTVALRGLFAARLAVVSGISSAPVAELPLQLLCRDAGDGTCVHVPSAEVQLE